MEEISREEHIAWVKKRALEYAEKGDIKNAVNSFISDLSKHSETANHLAGMIGFKLFMSGNISTPQEAKDFIEGIQ